MLPNNVVLMQTKSVNDRIASFLDEQKPITRKNYLSDIKQFFKVMRNVDLSVSETGVITSVPVLKEEHLMFDGENIRQYKRFLKKKYVRINPLTNKEEPVGATVERKMKAIKSLFTYLSPDLEFIRMEIFNLKPLKIKSQPTENLTYEQYIEMSKLAMRYEDRGYETSLCIELLGLTGIRAKTIINITTQNFKFIKGYWVLEVEDKGEVENRQTIPLDLYNRLQKLRTGDYQHYFTISVSTLLRRVKELAKDMGLGNVTPHSLKKMGINDIIERTNDMDLAQRHGNHKNRETTRIYQKRHFDPSKSTSLMIGKTVDTSILEQYTKEELINLINNCSYSTKFAILQMATKK